MPEHKNPLPTVDIIIEFEDGIVLIERKNPPHGWAIPGGFIDYGEQAEKAAIREAWEETSLDVELLDLLGCYSDPERDPRHHTISNVYIAQGKGILRAADDAMKAGIFQENDLPEPLAFDHKKILTDYFWYKKTGQRPRP